jgi:hypothetical protein
MWNKMFVKASILKKKDLFIAIITWSYYGISHYEKFDVFETLVDAEKYILLERTNGALTYE